MNGDPNTARDDVLGALALIESTIEVMVVSADKRRLAFACAALRRANEKLRHCGVCGDQGCDVCPPDNVIPLREDNWSRKVPDTPALRLAGSFHCDPDPSCGAA